MPATSCPALGAPGGGPDTVKTTRFRSILAAALLVAMALAAYWPATGCGYIWDDDAYVVENEALRSAGGLWDIWTDVWETPQYYPLVHSTYWLEYHLWGLDPAGYHVVNILLHALGAVLLWRVLALLRVPGAWVAAAVFALHPVHVEERPVRGLLPGCRARLSALRPETGRRRGTRPVVVALCHGACPLRVRPAQQDRHLLPARSRAAGPVVEARPRRLA
jgi:hypothetical protein